MSWKEIQPVPGNMRYNMDSNNIEFCNESGNWEWISAPKPGLYLFKNQTYSFEYLVLMEVSLSSDCEVEMIVIGKKSGQLDPVETYA